MKLCPRCNSLSYLNSYFQKWMCNTCEHAWRENQLTPEQIHSILSLGEYPSVSYAGITCHKSGNIQVTVRSTVDADWSTVSGLVNDIFPSMGYLGKPHVSEYDNLTSELFGIATGIHGVTVDLHMVKTKKKVERIEAELMKSIRI